MATREGVERGWAGNDEVPWYYFGERNCESS